MYKTCDKREFTWKIKINLFFIKIKHVCIVKIECYFSTSVILRWSFLRIWFYCEKYLQNCYKNLKYHSRWVVISSGNTCIASPWRAGFSKYILKGKCHKWQHYGYLSVQKNCKGAFRIKGKMIFVLSLPWHKNKVFCFVEHWLNYLHKSPKHYLSQKC